MVEQKWFCTKCQKETTVLCGCPNQVPVKDVNMNDFKISSSDFIINDIEIVFGDDDD